MQQKKSLRCTMQVLLVERRRLGLASGRRMQSAGETVNLHRLAVDCFGAWVRLGCLYERDLPREAVEGLVALTFSSIHSPDSRCSLRLFGGHSNFRHIQTQEMLQ